MGGVSSNLRFLNAQSPYAAERILRRTCITSLVLFVLYIVITAQTISFGGGALALAAVSWALVGLLGFDFLSAYATLKSGRQEAAFVCFLGNLATAGVYAARIALRVQHDTEHSMALSLIGVFITVTKLLTAYTIFVLWRSMRRGLVLRDAAEPLARAERGQQPALVVTGEPVPTIIHAHPVATTAPGAIPTVVAQPAA
jgi:hypothetical protein